MRQTIAALATGLLFGMGLTLSRMVDPAKVLRTIHYEHPLFSLGAVQAQAGIPRLNASAAGGTETYFAGAWTRYGFHEDGFLSAVNLARVLLGRDPWAD